MIEIKTISILATHHKKVKFDTKKQVDTFKQRIEKTLKREFAEYVKENNLSVTFEYSHYPVDLGFENAFRKYRGFEVFDNGNNTIIYRELVGKYYSFYYAKDFDEAIIKIDNIVNLREKQLV